MRLLCCPYAACLLLNQLPHFHEVLRERYNTIVGYPKLVLFKFPASGYNNMATLATLNVEGPEMVYSNTIFDKYATSVNFL